MTSFRLNRKKLVWIFVITTTAVLFSCVAVYKLYFYKIPDLKRAASFTDWYQQHKRKNFSSPGNMEQSLRIESPYLLVDKIYRSMEGPMVSKEYFIEDNILSKTISAFSPKLLWITGYKVELYDDKDQKISDDFMCHNNLNLGHNNVLPWKVKTLGTDKRLFTLSEGQTVTRFPENCGIPLLSNQRLRIDYQVLNHNLPAIHLNVKQVVTLFYKYDKDCTEEMKALYQQSIFVTKQTDGPPGAFNEVPLQQGKVTRSDNQIEQKQCCTPDIGSKDGFPFRDSYGREFTGHWTIDDTTEVLTTDVSRMLNLDKDRKAYFVSVHVHPFCESLALKDQTNSTVVYTASAVNYSNKTGLKHISSLSSSEGVLLLKGHKYTLTSVYAKTVRERHTAMATMSLYLAED